MNTNVNSKVAAPPVKPGAPAIPVLVDNAGTRALDARPDTIDFRDQMYVATLADVPTVKPLANYLKFKVPVLDQGTEGACAGFGLATVANYLIRTQGPARSTREVSPWMLYSTAQQFDVHDESSGFQTTVQQQVGASARSAMKGWNKQGACQAGYYLKTGPVVKPTDLAQDARMTPLGAYFRVNHLDIVALHTALTEAGILYATCLIHQGWGKVSTATGYIPSDDTVVGAHAFAIVGYDENGLWMQNSWGASWGLKGFGHISYDDWLANGTDLWAARLGAPVLLQTSASAATVNSDLAPQSSVYAFNDLAPHIISIGDQGILLDNGDWAKSPAAIQDVFNVNFLDETKTWSKRRLVLYAHGGLVGEQEVVDRIASYWSNLKGEEIYLIGFVWHTDYFTTLGEILKDAVAGVAPEGILGSVKDFMLDRLDDTLEPIARVGSGKIEWDKMKANALAATQGSQGGARITADAIKACYQGLVAQGNANPFEIHLVGHSAGSIFLGPLIEYLTAQCGLSIETCTLWAPACTVDLFDQFYVPALTAQGPCLKKLALFTMDDKTERADNCADIYHKSLLYLVSDAFESTVRIPLIHPDGTPILGMEKFIRDSYPWTAGGSLATWLSAQKVDWVLSPNQNPVGSANASTSISHGGFSDDRPTLLATVARILNQANTTAPMNMILAQSANLTQRRRTLQRLL